MLLNFSIGGPAVELHSFNKRNTTGLGVQLTVSTVLLGVIIYIDYGS